MGHAKRYPERLVLRTSDDDSTQSSQSAQSPPKAETRGAFFDIRMTEMNRHFDQVVIFHFYFLFQYKLRL